MEVTSTYVFNITKMCCMHYSIVSFKWDESVFIFLKGVRTFLRTVGHLHLLENFNIKKRYNEGGLFNALLSSEDSTYVEHISCMKITNFKSKYLHALYYNYVGSTHRYFAQRNFFLLVKHLEILHFEEELVTSS